MPRFRSRSCHSSEHLPDGRHRFEHWYRDNTVYFITARCRDRYPAFRSEDAKAIFCDRFNYYTLQHGFSPWVWSVMDNHYHSLGWLERGRELGTMMQRIHGSVAKLVNDLLPERRVPFWRGHGRHDYFDGCIRDEKQCRRAYLYTRGQSVRHGICKHWWDYPHTFVPINLDWGVARALHQNAFMEGVRYKRYDG